MRSFMDIRDSGACYVDKTELIDQILERMAGVFMFLRPRGFGKSVNLSMLDAYLSLGYKGNTWFDGLRISDIRPDDIEKNTSPVIYLDLEGLPMDSSETFREGLAGRIADACDRFRGLETSERQDSHDIDILRSLRSKDAGRTMMAFSMSMLSRMLHREYGRKASYWSTGTTALYSTPAGSLSRRRSCQRSWTSCPSRSRGTSMPGSGS